MDKMASMRKFSLQDQLSFRSHHDIAEPFRFAASRLSLRGMKFDGRKYSAGHLANALALWASGLPTEELYRIVEPLNRRLEEFMSAGDGEGVPADELPDAEMEPVQPAGRRAVGPGKVLNSSRDVDRNDAGPVRKAPPKRRS